MNAAPKLSVDRIREIFRLAIRARERTESILLTSIELEALAQQAIESLDRQASGPSFTPEQREKLERIVRDENDNYTWSFKIALASALRRLAHLEQHANDPRTRPLLERYQACVQALLDMFEGDPLPQDDPAHFLIERLEALIRLKLIGPKISG